MKIRRAEFIPPFFREARPKKDGRMNPAVPKTLTGLRRFLR
jgi:hypothetical protein